MAMSFIGIDLQKSSFAICRLDADGSENFETLPLSGVAMKRLCRSLAGDEALAVGDGGNTAWFCKQVRPYVERIIVVDPRKLDAIRKSMNKTDRNDAWTLAFFLPKFMFSEMSVKSAPEAELSSLVQTRDMYVKQWTTMLNRIHALFVRRGLKLKKEGLTGEKNLLAMNFSRFTPVERIELESLRKRMLKTTADVNELDKAIEEIANAETISHHLAVVPFAGTDKPSAHVDVVSHTGQSDETDTRGRVTKRGDNRRHIVDETAPPRNLASVIRSRFSSLGGVELDLPAREPMQEPPKFD